MKNICCVFLLFVFLLPLPAKARLGETSDELVKRYGEPIKVAYDFRRLLIESEDGTTYTEVNTEILPKLLMWHVGGISLSAYIDKDNICQYVEYIFGRELEFYNPETTPEVNKLIFDLLEKNSNGCKWSMHDFVDSYGNQWNKTDDLSRFGRYQWKRSDGGHAIFYRSNSGTNITLTLYTGSLISLCEKLKMQKQEEKKQRKIELMNNSNGL